MQTGVPCQVLGHSRHAGPLEISRRANHLQTIGSQPSRNESGVRAFSRTDDHIIAIIDNVHQAVGEIQIKLDVRIR